MSTEIQWTDDTWNPVTGCSKVSPGCAHCYAERVAIRLWAKQYPPVMDPPDDVIDGRPRRFTDVQCHEDRLDQPLRWKKPRKVFVNSMSDLFHEDVPDAFIDRVFAVMALAPQHTFQILTKRAERMRDYMVALDRAIRLPTTTFPRWRSEAEQILNDRSDTKTIVTSAWPLPNVWLGVSVENQTLANARIPLLLQTPAAVRFISAEPLLGPVLLDNGESAWLSCRSTLTNEQYDAMNADEQCEHHCCTSWDAQGHHFHGLDWVIVGGESGAGARPCHTDWIADVVAQCARAGLPCFVKQLGSNGYQLPGGYRLRDPKGGDMAEWPSDLRVREFPNAAPPVR